MLHDEPGRIAALNRLEALDTLPEEQFENIVGLVKTVLDVPIATVTLVDRDRQWFKARRGLSVDQTPRIGSFCTHTIEQRSPLVIADACLDVRFAHSPLVLGAPFIRSYAGVPLSTPDGYNVGALCAMDTRPRIYSPAVVAILRNFAAIVSDELELRLIARRDHLTGALTRRGFIEEAGKAISRQARHGTPATLVMLDVDHFKSVNDTHGHAAGDRVLSQLAELCSAALRPSDALGRMGGEEFALLFPELGPDEAFAAAERFRALIAAHPFDIGGGRTLRVTASFGIAPLDAGHATTETWLAAADAWLYHAKRHGRNRCCAALCDEMAA